MKENNLDIKIIQSCVKKENIIWTEHCLNRLNQREILRNDVINTINTGKITEKYGDD